MSTILGKIKLALLKPVRGEDDYGDYDKFFDPWEDILPMFYGSYSAAFDNKAIELLTNLRDRKFERPDEDLLAYEMLQEILCKMDLCEYGGSPRGCWAVPEFAEILPAIVSKWREYANAQWGGDDFSESLSAHQKLQFEVAMAIARRGAPVAKDRPEMIDHAAEAMADAGIIEIPDEPGVYGLDIQVSGPYYMHWGQVGLTGPRVERAPRNIGPNRAARRAAASKRKGGAA